jgi:nucleotide-binding universal stress UspA family protein
MLLVPFDNAALSRAALVRARQFDQILDEGVVVITVIPAQNAQYARERGWLGNDEPFDGDQILETLRTAVDELAPDATFEALTVDRWAPHGVIGNRIRKYAREHDASIVFLGSRDAGRLVRSGSVGSNVLTDRRDDTMVISDPALPEIPRLDEGTPPEELLDGS